MKKISLSEKLILYFLLLGIGAILIISVYYFYDTKKALLARTFDQLTSLRIVKKNQVEQFFQDRSRDIVLLAEADETMDLCLILGRPGRKGTDSGMTDRFSEYLKKYSALGKHFGTVHLFSDKGKSLNGSFVAGHVPMVRDTTDGLDPGFFWEALRKEVVVTGDEVMNRTTGDPVMYVGTRITMPGEGRNEIIGMLILEISIDAINAIMLNNNPHSGLGLTGETYLVGADYLMRSSSRFFPGSILQTRVVTDPVNHALKENEGTLVADDYRKIPVLSSFSKLDIKGLDWVILAEIDLREAMIPVNRTRIMILILSSIIAAVLFFFAFIISRQITKPLVRLKNAALKVGSGRYDIDLPVTTNDEIGALTASFNIMAQQIKEKTGELQMERFGRMQSVIDGEEMERQRLSRELHDGIGQLLIAIKLRLESLLYQDGKEIKNSIRELQKYFDQIIDEVRRISNNLMPSVLEAFGIIIAFRNLFADTGELSGLRIHFESKGNFENLDKKTMTYIYRLTQEALHNVVKHAMAKEVFITLSITPELLTLIIRDDGRGFVPEKTGMSGGNGIHNMRERASLLKGSIDIKSAPNQGTHITVNIPIF
jgi:signal transduction histidine kinase